MDLLDWERVNFCHFRLPAWKQFMAVVPGDSYREISRVVGKIRVLTATPPADATFLFPSCRIPGERGAAVVSSAARTLRLWEGK